MGPRMWQGQYRVSGDDRCPISGPDRNHVNVQGTRSEPPLRFTDPSGRLLQGTRPVEPGVWVVVAVDGEHGRVQVRRGLLTVRAGATPGRRLVHPGHRHEQVV